jgi:hypothetical protein
VTRNEIQNKIIQLMKEIQKKNEEIYRLARERDRIDTDQRRIYEES